MLLFTADIMPDRNGTTVTTTTEVVANNSSSPVVDCRKAPPGNRAFRRTWQRQCVALTQALRMQACCEDVHVIVAADGFHPPTDGSERKMNDRNYKVDNSGRRPGPSSPSSNSTVRRQFRPTSSQIDAWLLSFGLSKGVVAVPSPLTHDDDNDEHSFANSGRRVGGGGVSQQRSAWHRPTTSEECDVSQQRNSDVEDASSEAWRTAAGGGGGTRPVPNRFPTVFVHATSLSALPSASPWAALLRTAEETMDSAPVSRWTLAKLREAATTTAWLSQEALGRTGDVKVSGGEGDTEGPPRYAALAVHFQADRRRWRAGRQRRSVFHSLWTRAEGRMESAWRSGVHSPGKRRPSFVRDAWRYPERVDANAGLAAYALHVPVASPLPEGASRLPAVNRSVVMDWLLSRRSASCDDDATMPPPLSSWTSTTQFSAALSFSVPELWEGTSPSPPDGGHFVTKNFRRFAATTAVTVAPPDVMLQFLEAVAASANAFWRLARREAFLPMAERGGAFHCGRGRRRAPRPVAGRSGDRLLARQHRRRQRDDFFSSTIDSLSLALLASGGARSAPSPAIALLSDHLDGATPRDTAPWLAGAAVGWQRRQRSQEEEVVEERLLTTAAALPSRGSRAAAETQTTVTASGTGWNLSRHATWMATTRSPPPSPSATGMTSTTTDAADTQCPWRPAASGGCGEADVIFFYGSR